jgi:hypothetical protein
MRQIKTFLSENVMSSVYNGVSVFMPKKTVTNETAAATPTRTTKPKTARAAADVVEVVSKPRVKSVKHSKAAAPAVLREEMVRAETVPVEAAPVNAHEAIAKIAYGYWEARGFKAGSPEQDWLRAEQEYLLQA